ncbi:hypothetical protein BT67DRAFT_485966 [Trichocladium antarcticum]|uniref:Lethal giant larvae (Lgl)-like C-terminal domain-containing protein n=1 Tax=Trichocladium antarcticum TaxID=1450529 RepID=A0AAN6ZB71_9PEZI|nr:hypothetical protein BT67DRAFT_485966 [Trichocladium antarcticum]
MASFLRSRQAGIQTDLSAGILPGSFAPFEQSRHGINSQISCIAYDPVQSLLAVGTTSSRFGPAQIYLFGHSRVTRTLTPPRAGPASSAPHVPHAHAHAAKDPTTIRHLSFVANRLVSLDSHGELALWDLDRGVQVAKSAYGRVSCVVTDPGLDWAFVGVGSGGGEVWAFDLDRERPAAGWRLPNFWRVRERELDPRGLGRLTGLGVGAELVALQLHPRDIGTLLIGYGQGAVVYSFKANRPVKFFEYVVPAGAPGGDGMGVGGVRRPRLTHAVWHPTGTFFLTAHEDGSLVFWDPKDGRIVAARSLTETGVHLPGAKPAKGVPVVPFQRVSWCCKQNPDDTALLVAGGYAVDSAQRGLTFLELGPTPIYATSSWEVLTTHFEAKRRITLPIPPGAEVADYCLVPRSSPYFHGAQDPIAILVMLTNGEVLTVTFPSGYSISPTNMLHPSLSFVHPFVQKMAVSSMPRERWLGLAETRDQGDKILQGGAPAPRRRKPGCDVRNIIQVAHADSTIRVWDVGYDDDIENPAQLQVDVARALDRYEDVNITAVAMADATGELVAGTRTGEVVVYKWGVNRHYGNDATRPLDPNPGGLSDASSRAEPTLKEGLQPYVLHEMMQGPISVAAVSDVGFVAVGSEGGFLSVIDMRGPSVIFQGSVAELVKEEKRSSFLKHSSRNQAAARAEFPTVIAFGVMTLEGDGYSSIDCFVGTNLGHVATFKILPAGQSYSVQFAGSAKVGGDKVIAICPVNSETGQLATATGPAVAGLRHEKQVPGVLVVVTQTEIRVFKPATAKGASKSFDDQLCDAARVAEFPGLHQQPSIAVIAVFGDRTVRAYSLPALKEIGRAPLPMLDPSRTLATAISRTGELFGWTGPAEIAVLPVWAGLGPMPPPPPHHDTLINPQLALPPRPTISNLQWISGTQYVSPTDLDLLVGGEDRPPSKRMMAAAAAEKGGAGYGAAGGGGGGGGGLGDEPEGWGQYLTRQLNERTEKLSMVDDAMNRLQETSQGWAEDVNKYVKKSKRDVLLGGVKKSLF